MNRAAAITGLGLITPLGESAPQTWKALLAGQYVSDHAKVPGIQTINRAGFLAETAGREAIIHAGWSAAHLSDPSTALVVATSKGPIETWLPSAGASPDVRLGLAQIAADLASSFNMSAAPRLTLSAACASGLHALIRAAMMIQSGHANRALVIATESSLHPLFTGSFRRLGVLAPEGYGCRPFDRDRKGFVLSEAAAAVCLESPEEAAARTLAKIDRYALAGDASHLTAGDPTGQTLRRLIKQVLNDQPIDLIHAHGTGTILNDPIELTALESQLPPGESRLPIYSHKGALGHSLGASGLISIVINCIAHQLGLIPGNIRTADPLESHRLLIAPEVQQRPVRRSMSLAAGFGGSMAAVTISSQRSKSLATPHF